MTLRKMSMFTAAATAAVLGLTSTGFAAPVPVYEFTFNETGSTAANTGSLNADGTLMNSSGVATDLHSADGTGVTGLPGDRAFDNTASTAMGSSGTGGRVDIAAATSLHGAEAITIVGWFKTAGETPIGSAAYLFDLGTTGGGNAGLTLVGDSNASVRLNVYGQTASGSQFVVSAANSFTETEEWIFIAATYDSTVSGEHNVKIYKGTLNDAVQLVASGEITVGKLSTTASKTVAIGNVSGGAIRPFDGFIDDLRVYDAALDLTELESLRSSALPEPASAALIAAGSLLFFSRRRQTQG